uniref:Uncharacterized protein n=1 Tax=Setaria digitata TaxID=48799 RepID=A0A915Q1H7_9BILA
MSRFLKPVDYSDDEDESRLVRAKPIDSKIARKLGSYAAGKDFVIGSLKSQQELGGSNMIVESSSNAGEIMDDKTKLEWCNKLGAKILKAKLQGKMDLVEKLEKVLHGQRESEESPSSTCKILFGIHRSDVPMMEKDGKNLEKRGRVDAIYHADKSIRDMVAEEKFAVSKEHIFDSAKAVVKHRLDDDWVVDDAVMAIKRSRKIEEKMKRRDRDKLIKGLEKMDGKSRLGRVGLIDEQLAFHVKCGSNV